MTTAFLCTCCLPGPDTKTKQDAVTYANTNRQMKALLEIAYELNWPAGYHDDLYQHDRKTLEENGDVPRDYVFILRELGTHLYPIAKDGDELNEWQNDWAYRAIKYHSGDHHLNVYEEGDRRPRMYLVRKDGTYKQITPAAAMDIVRKRGSVGYFVRPRDG